MAIVEETWTYDQAFAELELVLQDLEGGDLPLERALELYERGVALSAFCARKLEEAELRVRQWQPGDQTIPVEGWQEG
jgi:exodeoxyribonuclease VII small subunit